MARIVVYAYRNRTIVFDASLGMTQRTHSALSIDGRNLGRHNFRLESRQKCLAVGQTQAQCWDGSGCVNVGGAQCNGLTGAAVVRDFQMKINFHDGLQSMEARFCVDLATMAIKMSAPAYPTKSNALVP